MESHKIFNTKRVVIKENTDMIDEEITYYWPVSVCMSVLDAHFVASLIRKFKYQIF